MICDACFWQQKKTIIRWSACPCSSFVCFCMFVLCAVVVLVQFCVGVDWFATSWVRRTLQFDKVCSQFSSRQSLLLLLFRLLQKALFCCADVFSRGQFSYAIAGGIWCSSFFACRSLTLSVHGHGPKNLSNILRHWLAFVHCSVCTYIVTRCGSLMVNLFNLLTLLSRFRMANTLVCGFRVDVCLPLLCVAPLLFVLCHVFDDYTEWDDCFSGEVQLPVTTLASFSDITYRFMCFLLLWCFVSLWVVSCLRFRLFPVQRYRNVIIRLVGRH